MPVSATVRRPVALLASPPGAVKLVNTIVAGDTAPNGPGQDINGAAASSDHSLIGDGGTTGLVNGVNGNLVGSTGHTIMPQERAMIRMLTTT